ncbi:MAG: antitoxin Xre/MbcA/ParS toxin-binding domain-containing protein [Gammaproteobacteria bacterium]
MSSPSNEDKAKLASSLIAVLDSWSVSNADKIILLALPVDTKPRAIQQYQQGTPLPDDKNVQERAGHLLGIADALRLAYPRNAQGGELWLNRPCRHFNGRIPMTIMMKEGLTGITTVRMHIDCSYDWFIDDQTSQPGRPT